MIDISLFKNCIFDGNLNDDTYAFNILNNLPEDFLYEYRTGASKLVIIPKNAKYVFKIPFNKAYNRHRFNFHFANNDKERCWDYCFKELLVYTRAKKEKVHFILAPERLIGTIKNHPIYIQQRAVVYSESKYNKTREWLKYTEKERKNSRKLKEDIGYPLLNNNWLLLIIEHYGEKKANKILSFLKENEVFDLHNDNLGFINDNPVIIDYSGFDD